MSEFKRLEPLVEYMNDNDSIFGWKSRCEALTELAESLEAELADKDKQLAEARAEVERLKGGDILAEEYASQLSMERKIFAKQVGLIEQMREALRAIDGIGRESGNARREDALRCFAIAAAALAAERGEGI